MSSFRPLFNLCLGMRVLLLLRKLPWYSRKLIKKPKYVIKLVPNGNMATFHIMAAIFLLLGKYM